MTRMFRRYRIRKAHAMILESSRGLKDGRAYWNQAGGFGRWFLQLVIPVPLLGLHEDGARHLEALDWLEENGRRQPLTEEVLRRYHRFIYGGDPDAGRYRARSVAVEGSAYARPKPELVPGLMGRLESDLAKDQRSLDERVDAEEVLRAATRAHQRVAFIHPFNDGNGRVARTAMNHVLRRYGLGYAVLPPLSESREHFEALERAHGGDLEPLVEFTRRHLRRV